MNLRNKVKVAQDALGTISSGATLPTEANTYIHLAHVLLESVASQTLNDELKDEVPAKKPLSIVVEEDAIETPEQEQENQIAIILSGAVVIALSVAQLHQFESSKLFFYPVTYSELCDLCQKPSSAPMIAIGGKNTIENNFIMKVGRKVLSGELTFEVADLTQRFPGLNQHFEVIISRIASSTSITPLSFPEAVLKQEIVNSSEIIRRAFNEGLSNARYSLTTNENVLKFFDEFNKLMEHTISEHAIGKNIKFNIQNCLTIAKIANEFAKKVEEGTVIQDDCEQFDNGMEPYKDSHGLGIIVKAMLGAVAGLLIGVVASLLAPAGVISLAIASGLGFFTGGLAAGGYAKYSANQHTPELQMVNAAQRTIIRR
ncbi:MAG: hypothetical protein V4501_00920 [Pseudomonadota bacterium]